MKREKRIAIDIAKFSFAYESKPILEIDRLQIPTGSHTLICGESGCGKSTLMNLISGILSGYAGSLKVIGQELSQLTPALRDRFRAAHVGVIFQQFNLIPYLTVMENIRLALRVAGHSIDTGRIATILDHLQISSCANKKADLLSHGQQQRVAAARALTLDAELIIADEPTSALDDTNARLFDLLFREAAIKQRTVVVVSHDLRYRRRYDQVVDLAQINKVSQAIRYRKSA